jgi:hypothetical protein
VLEHASELCDDAHDDVSMMTHQWPKRWQQVGKNDTSAQVQTEDEDP